MPDDDIPAPSEVESKLRLGIFRQLERKYRLHYGNQTRFLCAAMLSWALREPPNNQEDRSFFETHKGLIEEELMKVHLDPDLAVALSILYTFMLIRLGPKDPHRSMDLADRATQMNIAIRSEREIYPTDDAAEFLRFLYRYANSLLGT